MAEQLFSLKTIEDLEADTFRKIWNAWQQDKAGDEANLTLEVKKSYAEGAIADLQEHRQFLAASAVLSLPEDKRIIQHFARSCSFSECVLNKYTEWRNSITSSKKAADERLVFALANEIGNSYIHRFDTFHSNATVDSNLKRKRDANVAEDDVDDISCETSSGLLPYHSVDFKDLPGMYPYFMSGSIHAPDSSNEDDKRSAVDLPGMDEEAASAQLSEAILYYQPRAACRCYCIIVLIVSLAATILCVLFL